MLDRVCRKSLFDTHFDKSIQIHNERASRSLVDLFWHLDLSCEPSIWKSDPRDALTGSSKQLDTRNRSHY